MALEFWRIRVLNWEKHNPGRNGKKMPWFKMSTSFLLDEKMALMCPTSKFVFVGLLCLCSDKGRDELVINLASLGRLLGIKPSLTRKQLGILSDSSLIQIEENIDEKKYQSDKIREEKIRRDEIRVEREKPIQTKTVKHFIKSAIQGKEIQPTKPGFSEEDIPF